MMYLMKVLVVGNGAREHAIVKKLAEEQIDLSVAMSKLNPGIASLSKNVDIIELDDTLEYSKYDYIDLAFIGPESPLAAGVVDYLEDLDVSTVGPRKAAAKLEWSKSYARRVLRDNKINGNPEFKICKNIEEVKAFLNEYSEVAVKPDVLTGGKGVKITGQHLMNREEVEKYAAEQIRKDGLVVIEEKLIGREFTLQAFCDGKNLKFMPIVRDFKRAYDNDRGPNTGSMGSFSCANHDMLDLDMKSVEKGKKIMRETIEAMKKNDNMYKGILYGGFMTTKNDTYLIEYNCRFGDPEAINVLSLLEKPLTEVGYGIIDGNLPSFGFEKKATVCVYIVPEGYPTNPIRDQPIEIGESVKSEIYYASVYADDGAVKTTSSRSIALLNKGDSVSEAREKVYSDVDKIRGRLHYRTDIAAGVK
jgi:phosphoribosylamine--glycine ligase